MKPFTRGNKIVNAATKRGMRHLEENEITKGAVRLNLKRATKEEVENDRCKQYDYVA